MDAVTRVVEAVFTEPEEKKNEEENDVSSRKPLRKRAPGENREPFWAPQGVAAD